MTISKLVTGFLGLALAAAMAQAEGPTISCKIDGTNLIVTYTGELYQSTDAVKWIKVDSASSPYQVTVEGKSLFFCTKDESENKNFTIPLSDTVNLDMIWIEPGTFMMGSPKNELGRYDDETQHSVTISSAFWIGKYEVTQSQYKAVMDFNPCEFIGANLPVEKVSWNEAMEFCSRLTDIEREAGRLPEGYEYTLPTEAQWEYACRAGTTTALNSGKDLSNTKECPEMDEVGWYWYNGGREDYYNDSICTHPVGQKKPNAWGIYDMHGNVQEWCKDWYEDDYPSSSVTDPTGPGSGSTRVLRGGCWGSDAVCCRSAYRSSYFPSDRNNSMGFRVALSRVQ